ncbi:Myo-inositol 2-dehydrogenase / D-chiro-inositol 1-dehydrogenase/scyllo-inositol 2-dehydrogenase (NAD+) [uncultured Defluviicoccus sp.]|uniref:Myo-inositol 2-dehydrogenase / D-chiro-inositol 1-dehydrogenase/scyllo-inositol 2-dehydrogenase (NAD+) n=1 Tax=metagenome TaxID=256318 RepID=A0A380TFV7_9ZZZZ|nr:Myo-inositol 2-dehydrogenase / D-chiro-inositol 1-dehydrogenase/scyllo-inositol 2-dehydrogenase (NAD+) [uncultured Defluviicoccus sp.]
MASRLLGIALIGSGRAGLIHARNFASAVPGAKLVALADPVPAALAAAAGELGVAATFGDYRAALDHPGVDAIVIATPTALHREIAVTAAAAGKHVFCEKPMAMDAIECDAMIEAARRARVVLQIGFMRRFSASFLEAKARVEAGEIGAVVQVKTLTHGPSFPRPWMFDLAVSNGPLAEVNSHDIDSVRWFCGDEFAEVYALAGNYRTPEARSSHPDFYDQVLLTARMAGGAQGCVSGAQGVQYAYDARCEILGTHGLITIGTLNGSEVVACTREKELRRPAIVSWMNLFREAYLAEDIDFVACIREGRTPRAGGADGRAVVAVVNAGNLSIREHRPVALASLSP